MSLGGYAFADDTYLVHTAIDHEQNMELLHQDFHKTVGWFFAATGGAIKPTKPLVCMLHFIGPGKNGNMLTASNFLVQLMYKV
jgi:hypothetical protein